MVVCAGVEKEDSLGVEWYCSTNIFCHLDMFDVKCVTSQVIIVHNSI